MEKELKHFLQDLKFSGKAENTIETYRLQLQRYLAFLAPRGIDYKEVTNNEVKEFRNYLAKQGRAPATINLAISAIRAFYEFFVSEGMIQGNPVSKRLNVKEPEHLPAFLTEEEETIALEWLRQNTPDHIAFAFETMRATGIRVSEAAALTGNDIFRLDGKVFLRVRSGKGKKERYAPVLSASVAQKLLEQAQERHNELLFGVKDTTLKNYAIRCRHATGIDFHSHRLRHTTATRLLADGVALDVIQEVLGHSDISTTRRYATTLPQKVMALAANISK